MRKRGEYKIGETHLSFRIGSGHSSFWVTTVKFTMHTILSHNVYHLNNLKQIELIVRTRRKWKVVCLCFTPTLVFFVQKATQTTDVLSTNHAVCSLLIRIIILGLNRLEVSHVCSNLQLTWGVGSEKRCTPFLRIDGIPVAVR